MHRCLRAGPALRIASVAALIAAAALLLALATSPAGAQSIVPEPGALAAPPTSYDNVIDQGTLIISQRGRPVRAEDFTLLRLPDTLVVRSASSVSLPGQEPRPIDKTMGLVVGPLDFAMGSYASWQSDGPDTLRRGINVSPGDTVMTVWRQFDMGGTAEAVVQPPGRMYILDPPLFTMFNYLGWTLHGKVCDRRTVNVFVLGPRDSLVAATVSDVGNETIRWAGRPIVARKLVITDETTSFTGWYSLEDGRMYRLEQFRDSIRVDRKAPPLKRQPPRTK